MYALFFQLADSRGMQAHIFKHVVLLSCLCLDHNCSLGSQNKICQVILAEGQADWTKFLPDTIRSTSVESHSDSSLFSTFKHKIWRGLQGRMVKALLPLTSWNGLCFCLETTRSYQPWGLPIWSDFMTIRSQDWWPCVDPFTWQRTGGQPNS